MGDVYFFDIPLPKIEKLIKSNVPELRGQFPFSITFVLRLMLLASKGDDPEDAKAKVLCLTVSQVECSLLAGLWAGLLFSQKSIAIAFSFISVNCFLLS